MTEYFYRIQRTNPLGYVTIFQDFDERAIALTIFNDMRKEYKLVGGIAKKLGAMKFEAQEKDSAEVLTYELRRLKV